MTPRITVSRSTARRYLLLRSGLLGRRPAGLRGALRAVRQMGRVQLDPIAVIERSHHLTLHSRVARYEPSHLDTLLYRDRALFEYHLATLSAIPIEDYPYVRRKMLRRAASRAALHADLAGAIEAVRRAIAESGPLPSTAFEREGDARFPRIAWGWFPDRAQTRATKVALDLLWGSGEAMVHHREGNVKWYDLAERVLPPGVPREPVSDAEHDAFMPRKYVRAAGLATGGEWDFGWIRVPSKRALLADLVERGAVVPVGIEGSERTYVMPADELPLLRRAARLDPPRRAAFLAPLDPVIWERGRTRDLFEFDYRWEVYVPAPKRRWGHYVLPILYGDRLVGRFDARLDRPSRTLHVLSLSLEDGVRPAADLLDALRAAFDDFLRLHGAGRLRVGRAPRAIRQALAR